MQDETLRAQIEQLREKIRDYKPKSASPTAPLESAAKDVIKLGKKNKDGTISRVVETASTTAAE